jgi:hypothetical protein
MSRSATVLRLSGLFLLLAAATSLTAAPVETRKAPAGKTTSTQFLRVKRDAKGQPVALQTAVVRYAPASGEGGLTVDLIGAVHIADRPYYEQLNKLFDKYDVVLYELVAPKGKEVPRRGRKSDNPVAMLQQLARIVLDLDYQMDRIDYTKKNFVHADLSPEGIARAIQKRGDDGLTLLLGITADILRQQNLREQEGAKAPAGKQEEFDLSELLDPKGAPKLKRIIAEQFADAANGTGLGHTIDTILIGDRNEAAMKVFQKELAKGRKKIAIFYGAAHLPDFEKRLRGDFGLKRQGERWLTAWDLTKEGKGLGLEDLLKLLEP